MSNALSDMASDIQYTFTCCVVFEPPKKGNNIMNIRSLKECHLNAGIRLLYIMVYERATTFQLETRTLTTSRCYLQLIVQTLYFTRKHPIIKSVERIMKRSSCAQLVIIIL